jgi:hypothetical protein
MAMARPGTCRRVPCDAAISERRIDHPPRADLRHYFREDFERAALRANGRIGNAEAWFIPA